MSDPVEEAADAALRGELVVIPTDTIYGIGTRPDDDSATSRLFEAKRRPKELELPVLVTGVEQARSLAELDARAERLASALWPGPLTLILPRADSSRDWELGGDGRTIGLRVPRHALALAVLALAGPLAVTSANVSGDPTPSTCEGLFEVFGELVSVYICEEVPLVASASTVVEIAHGEHRILREGSVTAGEIDASLGG